MKAPPPSDAELREMMQYIPKGFTLEPYTPLAGRDDEPLHETTHRPVGTPAFWEPMLDLIYTGNEAKAWEFLDWVWPKGKPGKEAFLTDFKDQLLESAYGEIFKWKYRKSAVPAEPAP